MLASVASQYGKSQDQLDSQRGCLPLRKTGKICWRTLCKVSRLMREWRFGALPGESFVVGKLPEKPRSNLVSLMTPNTRRFNGKVLEKMKAVAQETLDWKDFQIKPGLEKGHQVLCPYSPPTKSPKENDQRIRGKSRYPGYRWFWWCGREEHLSRSRISELKGPIYYRCCLMLA